MAVFPRLYRVVHDLPGIAPANSYLWYDPRVHPSVRVVSFPFANHGRLAGLEADGDLEPCDGVILPQLSDWDASAPPTSPPPTAPRQHPPLSLVRGA